MRPADVGLMMLLLLLGAVPGCASKPGNERFIPTTEAARTAVAAVLDAWQRGGSDGLIAGASPKVHAVDQTRQPGQRLLKYQIVGELPSEGPRVFAVRLTTEPPQKPDVVRYVVVGIDPLWVFRQADFDKMAHWEMNMDHDAPEAATSATSKR